MPALVVHYLVGDIALKRLNMNFSKKEREAFDLGCQGGDIFFFYNALEGKKYPLLKKAGPVLHKRLINVPIHYMNVFANKLENIKNKDIVKAYIMGYLCHYSTDTVAHPYIYGLSDMLLKLHKKFDDFYYHAKIEANLDVIMLSKIKNKTIIDIPPYTLFPSESVTLDLLSKMYSFAFEKAGYAKAPYKEYYKAFVDFRKGTKLLYSKGTFKRNIFFNILKALKVTPAFSQMIHPVTCDNFCDYINLSKKEIAYNNGTSSTDSFFEIFEKSVKKTIESITFYQKEKKSISDIMEGRSFDTGLIIDETRI